MILSKRLLLILTLPPCLILSSCQSSGPILYDGTDEMETVAEFMDTFTSGDIDAAGDYLMEGSMHYGPAQSDSLSSEEWESLWKDYFKSLVGNIQYERTASRYFAVTPQQNPLLAGHWVMEWGVIHADYIDSTSASVWWHGAFRVEKGKINLSRVFYDREDLMKQRGFSWEMSP